MAKKKHPQLDRKKPKNTITAKVWTMKGHGKMTRDQFMVSTLLSLKDEVGKLSATVHTLKAYETMVDEIEKAKAEPAPPTPEPWVPAKGDMVRANDKFLSLQSVGHDAFPNPMRVDLVNDDFVYVEGDPGPWNVKNLRPATEAEITRYEQEQVTELQEGDSAHLDSAQRKELEEITGERVTDWPEHKMVTWFTRKLCHTGTTAEDDEREIPGDIFLKRAKGTAARLKREAEEAEAKKPIAFGTRVKHIREDREYKIACDMPDKMGSYYLVRPGDALQLCTYAKRHEFTILP